MLVFPRIPVVQQDNFILIRHILDIVLYEENNLLAVLSHLFLGFSLILKNDVILKSFSLYFCELEWYSAAILKKDKGRIGYDEGCKIHYRNLKFKFYPIPHQVTYQIRVLIAE